MLYVDLLQAITPGWLSRRWGGRWRDAMGVTIGALGQWALEALWARSTSRCQDDALELHADTRQIPRAPSEPSGSFRARLVGAFGTHEIGATVKGIETQFDVVGMAETFVMENVDWQPDLDATNTKWWRFWVVVPEPHGIAPPSWFIGDPGVLVGDSGLVISSTDAAKVALMRSIVRRWKGAHSVPVSIIVLWGTKLVGDGQWTVGDGTLVGGHALQISP